ncbi:hypothetical protein M3Y94_00659500 [Aphelenchoides besseyi]|nr:hypothetical protein M3Y94_00659500 [Aphelenchoides besseyi]KAI6231236.1 hypothetical protein M3Y95_00359900 [Aphelenchoides besseyi]
MMLQVVLFGCAIAISVASPYGAPPRAPRYGGSGRPQHPPRGSYQQYPQNDGFQQYPPNQPPMYPQQGNSGYGAPLYPNGQMNSPSYQPQGPPQGYPQDPYQVPASSPAPPPESSTTTESETTTESSTMPASSTVSSSTTSTSTVSGSTDPTTTSQSTTASTTTEQSTTTAATTTTAASGRTNDAPTKVEAASSPDTSKIPESTKKNPDEVSTTKKSSETTKKHLDGDQTTKIPEDDKTTKKPPHDNEPTKPTKEPSEPSKPTKEPEDDDDGDDGEGGGKPGHHPHWCKGIRPKTQTCEARDRNSTVSIACECGLHFGVNSLALQTAVGVCDSDCKTDKKNVFEYVFKGSDQPNPIAAAAQGHTSMFIKCPKMENFCACNHEHCCTFKEQVGFNLLQVLPHCGPKGCKNHMFIHGPGKLECKAHDGKGNVTIFDATKQDVSKWDHEEHLSDFTSLSCLGCDRIGGKKTCVKN